MRFSVRLLASLPLLIPGGCVVGTIAQTAVDVASLPVNVVGAGVDAAVPSQKKADEKRGRELRKADEQRGREERAMRSRCAAGRALPNDTCPSAMR